MRTGDIIRTLREYRGMSQADLAEALDLSRSSVSMYEANKRIPSTYVLQDLSDLFNVDIDYLLGKTDKTTVLPERLKYESKNAPKIIYQDDDFTLTSSSRKLEDEQTLRQALLICTSPVDDRPSREDMLYWLRENVRSAAFTGANYEDRDDESLYRLYKELRDEAERYRSDS